MHWLAKTMTERRLERPRSRAACCAARAALSRATIGLNFPLAPTWKAISATNQIMNFVAILWRCYSRRLSTPYLSHQSSSAAFFLKLRARFLLPPSPERFPSSAPPSSSSSSCAKSIFTPATVADPVFFFSPRLASRLAAAAADSWKTGFSVGAAGNDRSLGVASLAAAAAEAARRAASISLNPSPTPPPPADCQRFVERVARIFVGVLDVIGDASAASSSPTATARPAKPGPCHLGHGIVPSDAAGWRRPGLPLRPFIRRHARPAESATLTPPRRRRAIRDWIDRRRSDSGGGGGGLVGCVLALVLVLVLVGCVLALLASILRSYSFDARTFVNPASSLSTSSNSSSSPSTSLRILATSIPASPLRSIGCARFIPVIASVS